jgi:hypothetical protein
VKHEKHGPTSGIAIGSYRWRGDRHVVTSVRTSAIGPTADIAYRSERGGLSGRIWHLIRTISALARPPRRGLVAWERLGRLFRRQAGAPPLSPQVNQASRSMRCLRVPPHLCLHAVMMPLAARRR